MSTLDLHEQEQIDALKAWWRDNGKWLLLMLALALGGFAAMRGWQSYKSNQAVEAATLFAELGKQIGSGDPKRVNDAAAALIENYGSSAYAPRASLLAAQVNNLTKDAARAKTQLQWVIKHADEEGLKNVARLNLANMLLDEKSYDEALALLDTPHPDSFAGLYTELKGDVLNAQGKTEAARAAYQQVLDKTDAKSAHHNLVQMKLDTLGGKK
ncbi:MAG: tetratricopeptide repeat protein [Nitrosomonadales bacterium]|nr:tetratricopeptide repeat protein [Nitrosomonadales bacterium]